MAAQFPGGVRVFVPKVDLSSFVVAEDVNLLQEEVTAIETAIGTGVLVSAWTPSYATPTTAWTSLTARLLNIEGYLSSLSSTKQDASTAATLTGTQTLTNKTLTAPVIGTIVNTGTLTLPTSTDTLVGRDTTDTLTNKTLTAPVIGSAGASFSGSTGSTILRAAGSAAGTLTLPPSTDTLVGRATTDTLTNKTLTAPVMSTIVNTGTLTLPTSTDTLVGRSTTDTLTNKTMSGTQNSFSNIPQSAITGLVGNFATLTGTETISNKTLTTFTLSGGSIASSTTVTNNGTISGGTVNPTTLQQGGVAAVTTSGTQTMTNKTLTSPVLTGADIRFTVDASPKTGNYTLDLSDVGKLLEFNAATAITVTVPADSAVNYPLGTQIPLLQTGAGQVTVAGAATVTVNGTPGLKLRTQWAAATLLKRASNTWLLLGDTSA